MKYNILTYDDQLQNCFKKTNEHKNIRLTLVTKILLSAYLKMHIYQIIQTRRLAKNFFPTHKPASWPMLYGEQTSICIFLLKKPLK